MREFSHRLLSWMVVSLCLGCAAPRALAQKAAPDVLIFTNGDQLTGKLVRAAGGSAVFKSEMAGELTIPLDKVKELRSTTSFVALRKGETKKPVTSEGSVELAAGAITLNRPDGQAETIPAKDVVLLMDRASYDKELAHQPGLFAAWNGTVTAGASLVRSTQNTTSFTMATSLVRAIPTVPYLPPRNRTKLNVVESYSRQTSPVIPPTNPPSADLVVRSNIFHADAEHDRYFSPRMYALAQVAFDHNYAQGLQLQQSYGGGLGLTVVKNARQQWDVKADVDFQKQQYFSLAPGVAAPPAVNIFGSILSSSYMRHLPHKLEFSSTLNYLPAWTEPSAYSANGNAMLALPVYKRLNASVTVIDSYLNDPAPNTERNSFQFVTGVTYSLR